MQVSTSYRFSEAALTYCGKDVRVCGLNRDATGYGALTEDALGGTWYLAAVYQTRNGVESDTVSHYLLARNPFVTNQSRQPKISGWLGSQACGTYGTSSYALGTAQLTLRNGRPAIRKSR